MLYCLGVCHCQCPEGNEALFLEAFFCQAFTMYSNMCAVPNMAVVGSSLISWFPGMLLRYCMSDFEIVPIAPVITGINFAFIFHMH